MAIKNDKGQLISYDSDTLINELLEDIGEFGKENLLEVITEEKYGVKIYKDYIFADDTPMPFELADNEQIEIIRADKLLEKYYEQNKILWLVDRYIMYLSFFIPKGGIGVKSKNE